jgi:flavin reductase (DIM6/NTAB) family NADH-FMN oxidoreductase RutF/rubredoxin
MIDYEAFFKITYGLYVVASGDETNGNGFISNTVFQITADPPQFAASCNKNNFTTEFIQNSGYFSVSVLSEETPTEIYTKFGYKSGKEIKKFESSSIKYGSSGVPIVLDGAIAYLEMKVVKQLDMGSHILFIGEVISSEILDEKEPITYAYYRKVKKAASPKNAPTYIDESKIKRTENQTGKRYKCVVCGHIYDDNIEEIKFSELPDDWVCPICGSEKEDYIEIT